MGKSTRPVASYHAPRLRFVAAEIQKLSASEQFEIVTPDGTFRMTREEFERDFDNVARSKSYREAGYYHYPTMPSKAARYLV